MSGGWNRDNRVSTQAPKYHGLVNQGATCYLNSVLQVLFMTDDFREAVERYADENRDTIDRHLKSLFNDLQKYPTYTFKITRALDIDRVYEQRDAAEYIEKILRKTSDGASKIFHGLMSHRTICRTCGTQTDRDEAFWHLPLALVDSCSDVYSVVDGIEDFFKLSVFSGENQIYCDECDVKVDATAQYVMKCHPDVLILLLKRFEFSYHHMSYVKIHHVVDVPFTIQIPEGQTYKLYAVVDHSGDLRGGHYTATIKDEDEDRWYNFNDSSVSLCHNQPFKENNTETSQTSQLLFYRKTEEAVNQDNMSTNHNQCEDAEKTRQRDEGEDDVETSDDTAVTPSVIENEVTGNEDVVRDVSRVVGLSEEPDNEGNVIQAEIHNNQEQEIEEGTQIRDDEKDMRENAEADDQTQNAQLTSVEIKPRESIKKERRLDANFKPEVSDSEYRVPRESRVMDKDKMTGDKESEKPPMDDFDKDAEHLSEGGLYKQNRNEDQDSNLKTGQQFDPENMKKQEDERKTGVNKFKSVNVKHLANYVSECKHRSSSRLDKTFEQQKKEEREVEGNNEQERRDQEQARKDKKYDGNENPDNGRCDAQSNISKYPSLEFRGVVEEGNVETLRYEVINYKKSSCRDGRVGSSTRSKPDNQKCKRDISQPLGRNDEDKKGERNDSKRDSGHDQRRESARKCSDGGKVKDSGRLDEGKGDKNVNKQAKENEEEKVDNKGQHNQPDVESVQHSDKETGPAKTNKRKRFGSNILSCIKIKKGRTEVAEETSNTSHDDQNSLTESVSNLMLNELAVPESNKRKIWGAKQKNWKQHGEEKEKKQNIVKHRTPGCFAAFSSSHKSAEQSEEEG